MSLSGLVNFILFNTIQTHISFSGKRKRPLATARATVFCLSVAFTFQSEGHFLQENPAGASFLC